MIVMLRVCDCKSIISISASDWIALISGLLAYYGTVLLAAVTVKQNEELFELQKRHDEIEEIGLRNNNQPNFRIVGITTSQNNKEEPVNLKPITLGRFDNEFVALVGKENGIGTFYMYIENTTLIDAYDVSLVEVEKKSWFQKNMKLDGYCKRQNDFYDKLFINIIEKIPSMDQKVITFSMNDDESIVSVGFTLTYRNVYNHWFYQDVQIVFRESGNKVECQAQINDSKFGKREINENGMVIFKDGTSLQFPREKGRLA